MTPAVIFPFLIAHSPSPCSPTSTWRRQRSFVRGVHLEQLCHTCFHVLLDYRAADSGFKATPPFSPFVSVLCTLVINFVLLLFVPVTRSPLFWASSPWSTRLEVFFFCEPWQVPNWMMNVPLFLCNWTASALIGLEDPPSHHHYPTLVDFTPPTRFLYLFMFTLKALAWPSLGGCLPSLPIHLSNNI